MRRLIDCNDVYNAIQITTDNFGVLKGVVDCNMLTMLSKIETVEAIPKDQYEARLKADMVAMLKEIQVEIGKKSWGKRLDGLDPAVDMDDVNTIIQQKINALKAEIEPQEKDK